MLEQVLLLSGAVTAFMEFVHMGLARLSIFTSLTEATQSLVLQVLAFVAGAVAAYAQGVNIFPLATPLVGMIATGLVAALGGEGIHVVLALIGIRAGSTAAVPNAAQAQMATASFRYAPWL